MSDRVLVTGISGFLAGQLAMDLLRRGFTVRGSLRDMARAERIKADFTQAGVDVARLEFCKLDLMDDFGWEAATWGCRYLQHTASPFTLAMPKDENELIRPAVEGTRRALRSALDAGLEHMVLTSSVAAIDGGHVDYQRILGPADWTDLNGMHVNAYAKSKTLAEREAWTLVERAGARTRLSVINPGAILGPLPGDDPGTSAVLIQRMLKGRMPMLPGLIIPYVDIRDVSQAHIAAMTAPSAAGTRTIITNPAVSLMDINAMLRHQLGRSASRVPALRMPNWLARAFALVDASLRDSRTYLDVQRRYDTSAALVLLGRSLRPTAEAVEATARSLIERQLA